MAMCPISAALLCGAICLPPASQLDDAAWHPAKSAWQRVTPAGASDSTQPLASASEVLGSEQFQKLWQTFDAPPKPKPQKSKLPSEVTNATVTSQSAKI